MVLFSASASMNSIPKVAAARGSGARFSIASQNGPDRLLISSLPTTYGAWPVPTADRRALRLLTLGDACSRLWLEPGVLHPSLSRAASVDYAPGQLFHAGAAFEAPSRDGRAVETV